MADDAIETEGGGPNWWRLGGLLFALGSFAVFGHFMGWTDGLTPESIQTWVIAAGAWGVLLYVGAFAVGNLMQVPGMWFIVAGMLVYGPLPGAAISAVAAMFAVTTSFAIVRVVGGKPLGAVRNRWVRKVLDGLNDRPIFSIAAIRLVMVTSPPLNYMLAMSDVKSRDYLIGSACGLIIPIVVTAASIELGLEAIEGFGIIPV